MNELIVNYIVAVNRNKDKESRNFNIAYIHDE